MMVWIEYSQTVYFLRNYERNKISNEEKDMLIVYMLLR